jgi:hypothetical protein
MSNIFTKDNLILGMGIISLTILFIGSCINFGWLVLVFPIFFIIAYFIGYITTEIVDYFN